MRIKIVSLVAVVAALAVGVAASNASFRTEATVTIKLAKAGAPAKATIVIDNTDTVNVPQRIDSIVIASKVAKYNSKAVPQCTTAVPTNAAGNNTGGALNPACPAGSKVGTGTFEANTGVAGQPIPFNDLGVIDGTINVYNYKPAAGQQASMLIEIMTNTPVPDTHQYMVAGVSSAGVITSNVPNTADLPPNVANLLRVNPPTDMGYRTTAIAKTTINITSPKAKAGKKPFLTLKNTKNMDFSIVLNRG